MRRTSSIMIEAAKVRDHLLSARNALIQDGYRIQSYELFESVSDMTDVCLWQPSGEVDDLPGIPSPYGGLRPKATAFIAEACSAAADLALAPEWSYDIRWVQDHADRFFREDAPLFVLGCSPVERAEMEALIQELREDFEVRSPDVPDESSKSYVTPTIIPLKGYEAEDPTEDLRVLLIQYKTHPISDSANPHERANMATGDYVWMVDPTKSPLTLFTLTCSDILHPELRPGLLREARATPSIVAHVQCNPEPLHENWVRFRQQLFGGGDSSTTYISSNWGRCSSDAGIAQMGYSGIYSKAPDGTPPHTFAHTYENGGLPGTSQNGRVEYVWMMTDDSVSSFLYNSPHPAGEGPGVSSYADIRIESSQVWGDGHYKESTTRVPECQEECSEWREMLPDDPWKQELLSSTSLGKIDTSFLRQEEEPPVKPEDLLSWKDFLHLRSDGNERTCHVFASHRHTRDPLPAEKCRVLRAGFERASEEEGIVLNLDFDLTNIPFNGRTQDGDEPVSLVVVGRPTEEAYRRNRDWLQDWIELLDRPIESYMALIQVRDDIEITEGPRYENIASSVGNPRSVGPSGGPPGDPP